MPICFPWFSAHRTNKDFPIHGCVRFRSWELGSAARLSDGRARVKLVLLSNEATRAFWPYDFKLELTATVGKNLEVELTATNTGADPFRYDDCLHTYFAVGDVRKATVAGLDGIGYIDRINGDIRSVQKGILPIQGEITHVHTRVAGRVEIRDAEWNRKIIIEQAGMDENIVWNPWEATAAKNAEMAGLWKDFLCVESGNCMDGMVVLAPGCSHTSWVRYGAEKLT
jgi:D-hexose-6-phosphate mutarotase